jgi:hypothetical protein
MVGRDLPKSIGHTNPGVSLGRAILSTHHVAGQRNHGRRQAIRPDCGAAQHLVEVVKRHRGRAAGSHRVTRKTRRCHSLGGTRGRSHQPAAQLARIFKPCTHTTQQPRGLRGVEQLPQSPQIAVRRVALRGVFVCHVPCLSAGSRIPREVDRCGMMTKS